MSIPTSRPSYISSSSSASMSSYGSSFTSSMSSSSQHLPGDVAPLPSPTSRAETQNQYFESLHPQQQSRLCHPMSQSQLDSSGNSYPSKHPSQSHWISQQRPQAHCSKGQSQRPAVSQTQGKDTRMGNGREGTVNASVRQEQAKQQDEEDDIHMDVETSNHLQDFSLIAEAAKRAQVHCVVRDIEEMEL